MDPNLLELLQEGNPDDEISAIIRLHRAGEHPQGVRLVADIGRFVTVRLRRSQIPDVRRDPRVASMKAPDPVIQEADFSEVFARDDHLRQSDVRRPLGVEPTGAGVVVGVVDWGVDFAFPSFIGEEGATRFLTIWNQKGKSGDPPSAYGYGTVHDSQEIDQALATTDPYKFLRYHPADSDPEGSGSHGTHVLDIAAGNGRGGGPPGIAPKAWLAFVHLGGDATHGLANLGDSVNLVEAVHFIFSRAGDLPCCINLSIGNHGGPHDGSTLVEQALDELLLMAPGRAICQSTGNYLDRSTHSAMRLLPGQQQTLIWRTDRADRTPNEVEIWYPGSDRLAVTVTSPTGERSKVVALGERGELSIGGVPSCRIYHRRSDPQNKDHLINIFLDRQAPPGDWVVTILAEDVTDGRIHAWIERDEGCSTCQSRFASYPMRHGTTGTICNGRRTIAVGAFDAHTQGRPLGSFSSMGPTRDGRQKPDLVAPGVRVLAARSAPKGVIAGPSLVRKSGTSMAAPHVTGTVALMFEAAGRPLAISETRRLILASTDEAEVAATDRFGFGSGFLNIESAVRAGRGIKERVRPVTGDSRFPEEMARSDPDKEQSMTTERPDEILYMNQGRGEPEFQDELGFLSMGQEDMYPGVSVDPSHGQYISAEQVDVGRDSRDLPDPIEAIFAEDRRWSPEAVLSDLARLSISRSARTNFSASGVSDGHVPEDVDGHSFADSLDVVGASGDTSVDDRVAGSATRLLGDASGRLPLDRIIVRPRGQWMESGETDAVWAEQQIQRYGPGAQAPASWASAVSSATTPSARCNLVVRALAPFRVVDRTAACANDAAVDPAHLVAYDSSRPVVNYDDNLNLKQNRAASAGFTKVRGGIPYVVLGPMAVRGIGPMTAQGIAAPDPRVADFYWTRVVLNHEFDHVRQHRAGSTLQGNDSEVDAWTSSFVRDFHRTYVIADRSGTCYIESYPTYSQLSGYYSVCQNQAVKRSSVQRIAAYYRGLSAINKRVFHFWLFRRLAAGAALAADVNRELGNLVSTSMNVQNLRSIPCQVVQAATYPAPVVISPP